jgi:3-hydroxyisobutyrate dehydrogenase
VMGSSMCGHVLDAGYSVTVYTRTKARAQPLLDKGASWADNPAAVAQAADVIFTIVGFPEDVRAVLLGPDGVIENASPGATVVDMTTTEPSLAVELYDAARANSIQAIDAPVSGGDIGARNAALSIMVGGDDDAIVRVMPLLECMGKMIVRQGGAGAGQHTKMVNQILIASGMIGVCEALLYGYRAGLDLDTVLKSVGGGAAGSWSLANYGPRMLAGDYEPGFFVEHFIKDMGIALGEARRMGLALPGLALAHQLYVALEAQGGGRRGIQALLLALASISAVDWPTPEPAS